MSAPSETGRISVTLSLDAGLLRRAEDLTGDLSATVETLLAGFVARERARPDASRDSPVLAGLDQLRAHHGSLADDFSPL